VLGYIDASWELRSSIQEEEQISRFRRFDQPVAADEKAIVTAHIKAQNTSTLAYSVLHYVHMLMMMLM
jgi:hypothetical protein